MIGEKIQLIPKEELKIVFIGTSGEVSAAALDAIREDFLVVGVVEGYRRVKRMSLFDKYCRKNSSLKKYCNYNGDIPYFWTKDLNSKETEQFISDLDCTLICVCSAFQLLKQNIIGIPQFGVLNAHGAILPDYRGADPDYYIFRNFERMGGVTIHFIDQGEDTGDIIIQERYTIPFGMSDIEYKEENRKHVASSYQEALKQLAEGTVVRIKQGESSHSRCRTPKREDFLLDYENWDVKNAYHFLNGTGGVSEIYRGRLYSYAIDGFEETSNVANQKYAIQCKGGYIKVKRRMKSPKRIMKDIVKGILVRL